jgi:hypothetical protein
VARGPPAKDEQEPTAKRVRLEHLLQQFSEPLRLAQEPRLPEDHVPKYALQDLPPSTPFEAEVKGTKYRGIVESVCDAGVRARFESLGIWGRWQPHPDAGLFLPEEITAAGADVPGSWPQEALGRDWGDGA